MARQHAKSDGFAGNLHKIYALFTAGFIAFVLLLAILEQLGMPKKYIGYSFLVLTFAVYGVIGIVSRTAKAGEFYVAGRRVPAIYNGMATGADCMSGATFLGLAGTIFLLGYDGLSFVLGLTGGYVLVAILIAPYLHKFGAFTVPEFFAERFGGNLVRFLAVVVLICCSFTYVAAQIFATGLIASRFLDIELTVAIYVGLLAVVLCSMLGGMKAVTWTQVAQYIVLIAAYLMPVIILSAKKYGIPVPQLTYGHALQDIAALETSMVQKGFASAASLKPYTQAFTSYNPLNYFALILCLMCGTASLPHILMRYFTTSSVREARSSVAWSLFFIVLLYFTAPAYAAFSKLEVYSTVIGSPLEEIRPWLFSYGQLGLVKLCGIDAINLEAVKAACAMIPGHRGLVRLQDLSINRDVIVLSTPEIAGMPYVITALVAAGGLAAALSTANGLLLAIANALSHDIHVKMLDPKAPTRRRLVVARILLLLIAIAAAYTASTKPADIVSMMAWAFSLAAAGIFPALVLGIWWKRATSAGAAAGIILGFGICLYYLVGTRYFAVTFHEVWSWVGAASSAQIDEFARLKQAWLSAPDAAKAAAWGALDAHAQAIAGWWGVKNISAGLFGLPVGFVTIWIVSLLTPAPSQSVGDMVDAMRRPSGRPIVNHDDPAIAH